MAKKKTSSKSDQSDSNEEFAFEDAMTKIESIVVALESGKLGLGDSLKEYETAIGQLKLCHRYLESAERQVSVLAGVDADGNPVTEAFDEDISGESVADGTTEGLVAKQASRSRRRGASKPSGSAGSRSAVKGAKRGGADDSDDAADVPGLF